MNTKKNQHYQATHLDIQHALIRLLEQNHLPQISVRQICEVAGINRSTFYTHYSSVYDLWGELDSLLRESQIERFREAGIDLSSFLSLEGMKIILQFILDHRNFYCTYLDLLGSPSYIKAAFDELWNANLQGKFWKSECGEERTFLAFSFFTGGALNLILNWLNGGCTQPISLMAQALYDFMPKELIMVRP